MTNLLETLNCLLEWHQQNDPESANLWQPGLTIVEIETILKNLPFRLSREFYELYQWRNGGHLYFPLEIAVQEYYKMVDSLYPQWNPYWLPITDEFGNRHLRK